MDQELQAAKSTLPTSPPNSPVATVVLREQSRENQLLLIERLFSRLSAMYGKSFVQMWADTNLDEVKTLWAEKLGGFNAVQLGAGLTSIEERPYPPNLPEFLAVCRQCARTQRDSTDKAASMSHAEAVESLQKIGAIDFGKVTPNHQWAHDIVARWDAGDYKLEWQYGYEMACKVTGTTPKTHPSLERKQAYRKDIHG